MGEDVSGKIRELFDNRSADKYPLEAYRQIGRRGVRRLDGYEKASGQALYTIDVALPGMLYAKFLTSPYPHARIARMDTGKAEALPGVRAVLRYDDPDLPPMADLGGHVPNAIPVLAFCFHHRPASFDKKLRIISPTSVFKRTTLSHPSVCPLDLQGSTTRTR